MEYKIVKIDIVMPSRKIEVSFLNVDGDREETETCPNPAGFYYFPKTMNPKQAFEELKQCMINDMEQYIVGCLETIDSLKKIKYESLPYGKNPKKHEKRI